MPAAEAAAAATAGGKPAAAEATPLGLFAALLDLLGVNVTSKAAEAAPDIAGVAFAVPRRGAGFTPPPDMAATLSSAIAQLIPLAATEGVDAPPVLASPAPGQTLTPELLTSFVEQLTALQEATGNPTPLDPALENKLTHTLDALAAALGMPLPETPVVDPAITAAATVDAAAVNAVDPLATLDGPPADLPARTAALPVATPDVAAAPAPGAILRADGTSPLLTPAVPETPTASDGEPLAAGEPAPEAALPTLVKDLAGRILKLAEAIEPRATGLAQRLEALAAKLTSGDLDPAILAGFESQADADVPQGQIVQAVARLLAPGADPKPLRETARFVSAGLTLPKAITPQEDERAASEPKTAQPNADARLNVAGDVKPSEAPVKIEIPARAAAAPVTAETPDPVAPHSQVQTTPALPPVAAVAAETKAVLTAYKAPPVPQINIPQVAFEIVRQVQAGNSRFEIRLDPPELGRIHVKLDMDSAGNVNAKMTVERAETLDLMQRDRQVLERALAQAGLDGNKTNLEFSLRQNPFGREGFDFGGDGNGGGAHPGFGTSAEADAAPADTSSNIHRGLASAGGVNLFV